MHESQTKWVRAFQRKVCVSRVGPFLYISNRYSRDIQIYFHDRHQSIKPLFKIKRINGSRETAITYNAKYVLEGTNYASEFMAAELLRKGRLNKLQESINKGLTCPYTRLELIVLAIFHVVVVVPYMALLSGSLLWTLAFYKTITSLCVSCAILGPNAIPTQHQLLPHVRDFLQHFEKWKTNPTNFLDGCCLPLHQCAPADAWIRIIFSTPVLSYLGLSDQQLNILSASLEDNVEYPFLCWRKVRYVFFLHSLNNCSRTFHLGFMRLRSPKEMEQTLKKKTLKLNPMKHIRMIMKMSQSSSKSPVKPPTKRPIKPIWIKFNWSSANVWTSVRNDFSQETKNYWRCSPRPPPAFPLHLHLPSHHQFRMIPMTWSALLASTNPCTETFPRFKKDSQPDSCITKILTD